MKYNIKCPATEACYVSPKSPNFNFSGNERIKLSYGDIAFIKFDLSPLNKYKTKVVIDTGLHFYNVSAKTESDIDQWFLEYGYFLIPVNYKTVTYNTIPRIYEDGHVNLDDYIVFHLDYTKDYLKTGNVIGGIDMIPLARLENGLYISVAQEDAVITLHGVSHNNLYLTVTLEDFNGFSYPDSPKDVYVDPAKNNFFNINFGHDSNEGRYWSFDFLQPVKITSVNFKFQDLLDQSDIVLNVPQNYEIINTRGQLTAELPKNTLKAGRNYNWEANITTSAGTAVSDYSVKINTIDVTPDTPRIISPQSEYLDGEKNIVLQWQHNVPTGSTQYAFELDYMQTGGWTVLAPHTVSDSQSYTIPAGTLQAGNFQWRVRTYNTQDVPSPYSISEKNLVQTPPNPPVFSSVSSAPRLSASWSSLGQQAFHFFITDLSGETVVDSGVVYGVDRQYQIDTYLADGNYTVFLKIQNQLGEWSDAASSSVSIRNRPVGSKVLTATPVQNAVRLNVGFPQPEYGAYLGETILGDGKYLADQLAPGNITKPGKQYILRDEIPIAQINENTYIDYTSVGEHKYKLRITFDDGTYYDSPTVQASPVLPYATLAFLDSPSDMLLLKYQNGSRPITQKQITQTLISHTFLGRKLPCYDATGQLEIQWSFQYTLMRGYEDFARFLDTQKTVVLRDPKGERAVGLLQNCNLGINRKFREVSFDIIGVNTSEAVEFA